MQSIYSKLKQILFNLIKLIDNYAQEQNVSMGTVCQVEL